jgi:CheY-like chemotaxis protein
MQTRDVILYVEDDESDTFLFQRAFAATGISPRLVVVPTGKTAIDYLSGSGAYTNRIQHPIPQLVLLDLKMPGISGIDVLKWIRRTPTVSTLVVVMLTSSNQDADIHRAYVQGANGYLVKPSNIEDMIVMAKAVNDYWLVQNRASAWTELKSIPPETGASPPRQH